MEEAKYLLPYPAEEMAERLARPVPVSGGGTGQVVAYQTVTVTPNANITDSSFTCRYYPYLGMVFLRGNGKLAAASAANTWFTAASIPQEFLPAQTAAVTLSVPGGGSGLARYTGSLELRTFTDRAVGTSLDLTGWWFV